MGNRLFTLPFQLCTESIHRVFVVVVPVVLNKCSRHKTLLPLGCLARVLGRQPRDCFFPSPSLCPVPALSAAEEAGEGPRPGPRSGVSLPHSGICPPSPRRPEPTWRAGPGPLRRKPPALLGSRHPARVTYQRRPLGVPSPLPGQSRA